MYVICASIISCAPGTTARTSLIAASSSMLGGPALPDVADEYLTAFKCYALIVLQRLELPINDLIQCPIRCDADEQPPVAPPSPAAGSRARDARSSSHHV